MHKSKPYKCPVCGAEVPNLPMPVLKHQLSHAHLVAEMMKPYGGAIDIWEVGKDVGNVRRNKAELLDRVTLV